MEAIPMPYYRLNPSSRRALTVTSDKWSNDPRTLAHPAFDPFCRDNLAARRRIMGLGPLLRGRDSEHSHLWVLRDHNCFYYYWDSRSLSLRNWQHQMTEETFICRYLSKLDKHYGVKSNEETGDAEMKASQEKKRTEHATVELESRRDNDMYSVDSANKAEDDLVFVTESDIEDHDSRDGNIDDDDWSVVDEDILSYV